MAEMAGEGGVMPPSPHELVSSSTHAVAWCCVEQRLSGARPMAKAVGEGGVMPPSPHELVPSSTRAVAWCCVEQSPPDTGFQGGHQNPKPSLPAEPKTQNPASRPSPKPKTRSPSRAQNDQKTDELISICTFSVMM